MPEHRIRLRGGWYYREASEPEVSKQPITLPVRWGPDDPRRLVLTRLFGRPRTDRNREVVLLEMENVAGIIALGLNGQPIAIVSAETCRYEIELVDMLDRNVLIIEIQTPEPEPQQAGGEALWGMISLLIRPVEPVEKL